MKQGGAKVQGEIKKNKSNKASATTRKSYASLKDKYEDMHGLVTTMFNDIFQVCLLLLNTIC